MFFFKNVIGIGINLHAEMIYNTKKKEEKG